MKHRNIVALFLTLIILVSALNAYLKSIVNESSFTEELFDPVGIVMRIIIAAFFTLIIVRIASDENKPA